VDVVSILVLLLFGLALVGPLVAAVILAVQLTQRAR
jgi:hypothetical protein